MGVPPAESLARAGIRQPGKAPHRSERGAEGREACRDRSWGDLGSQLPHLPLLVFHPPAGAGPGHPNDPGATRPQGRDDHHDRYPRCQSRPARGPQPCGRSVTTRTVGSRTREPRLALAKAPKDPMQGKESRAGADASRLWFSERIAVHTLVHGTTQSRVRHSAYSYYGVAHRSGYLLRQRNV